MGAQSSDPQLEQNFLEMLKQMNEADFIDNDPIIEAAGKLRKLTCVSNKSFQSFFLKEPNNVVMLVVKCIDTIFAEQKNYKRTCGALLILSRFLPIIGVSYKELSDIAWLIDGDEPLIEKIANGVKKIKYSEGILNPEGTKDANEWVWQRTSTDNINARVDLLSIFSFFANFKFFFQDSPEQQEKMKHYILFEPHEATNWVKSIVGSLTYNYKEIIPPMIQYLQWAIIFDPAIQDAVKTEEVFSVLFSSLYYPIENINSIIPIRPDIEAYELDLMVCIMIIVLRNPTIKYDAVKMVESALRVLQIANEKGIVTMNHRVALLLLLGVTSSEGNLKQLGKALRNTLGTEREFHTDSISTALLEGVANTVVLPKAKDLRPLCFKIIRNASTVIPSSTLNAPACYAKLLLYFSQTENDEQCFNEVINSLKRYIVFKGEKEEKRNKMKAAAETLLASLSEDKKGLFNEAIACNELESGLESIENVDQQIATTEKYMTQLFMLRNKASLQLLKKNVLSSQ